MNTHFSSSSYLIVCRNSIASLCSSFKWLNALIRFPTTKRSVGMVVSKLTKCSMFTLKIYQYVYICTHACMHVCVCVHLWMNKFMYIFNHVYEWFLNICTCVWIVWVYLYMCVNEMLYGWQMWVHVVRMYVYDWMNVYVRMCVCVCVWMIVWLFVCINEGLYECMYCCVWMNHNLFLFLFFQKRIYSIS